MKNNIKQKMGIFLLVVFCFMLSPQSVLAANPKCDYSNGQPDESLWMFDETTKGKTFSFHYGLFDQPPEEEVNNKIKELENEGGEKDRKLYVCCPYKEYGDLVIKVTQWCDVWQKKEYIEPTLENVKKICRYNFTGVNGENFAAILVQTAGENGDVKLWDRTKGNTQNTAQLVFEAGDFDFITLSDNLESDSSITNQVKSGICPSVTIYKDVGGYVMTNESSTIPNDIPDTNIIEIDGPSESHGTKICTQRQLQSIKKTLHQKYMEILYNPMMSHKNTFMNWQPDLKITKIDQVADVVGQKFHSLINIPYNLNSNKLSNEMNDYVNNIQIGKIAEIDCVPQEGVDLQKEVRDEMNSLLDDLNKLNTEKQNEVIKLLEEAGASEEEIKKVEEEMKKNQEEAMKKLKDQNKKLEEEYRDFLTSLSVLGSEATISCEGLLGSDLLDLLHKYFGYLKIAAPILLIVMGGVDFGQAVLSDDKEALKKAGSKFLRRTIACAALFFLPYILEEILKYVDLIGTDPLCGIGRIVLK